MRNSLNGWYVVSVASPVTETYQGWSPCISWCGETFGEDQRHWCYVGEGIFEFREEKDCALFLLRWQ